MDFEGGYYLDSSYLDCLVDILPGEQAVQQILEDIADNLETNAVGVEQCLQELQSEVNESFPSELVQNTSDCLLWLNNCSLNSLKPSSTPHGQLLEFLRTLLSLLKKEQNQEDAILHFLQDLSSQCGVSFPSTPSGISFHFTSRSSLHAVDDDSSMEVKSVWDDVRLHLRRFLVDRLQNHQEMSDGPSKLQFRTQCLQHLSFLYPEYEVLTKYQSMQKKRVTDLLSPHAFPTLNETNFEKVVHSYQHSFSVLYAMIKDDMILLSEMLEPQLVVKFVKETFLEVLTEEVRSLLERLGEQQLKENTLHAVKGIKSKHKGAVHAMVTQENTKKGRNLCLNSNQLKSLSQLVKLLMWLEDQVKELSALSHPSYPDMNMHCKGGNMNAQGVLKKGGGELLDEETKANESNLLPERLLQPAAVGFGWRSTLKDLSPSVTRCLANAVEDFSSKILHNEQEQWSALGSTMSLVCNKQTTETLGVIHEEEQPKQISKFCSDIMEELDRLFPLALACRGDSLQEIRATFVEACCKVSAAVLARLETRSQEVPSEAPVQNLYAVLSSAIYIHQRFSLYDALMRETSKKPLFLVPVQRCQEFIRALQFQVTNYCIRVCAASILQDAESHHWDDNKAFYEGERCSFSVQMWHYFCCGLQHDLWTILPPKTAQEILAEVLEESLALLSYRYSQTHPTFKRTSQIRIDVTTILYCAENFLWAVCQSVPELCNPTPDLCSRIFKIHRHCNTLLLALSVRTAPLKDLKDLYEKYQNGLGDCSATSSEQPFDWRHWLYCLHPCFLPPLLKTPSAGEMVVLGQLKLLLSQPCCNLNLLLKTLLYHDCLIASILLSSSTLMPLQDEDQANAIEYQPSKGTTFTEAIFSVLSYCTLSPRSFSVVLERYMEEEQLWSFLNNMSVNTFTKSEPEVIGCLKRTVINSVKGLVKQMISLIHSWDTTENHGTHPHAQSVPESLLKTVPKEWNYVPKEMKRAKSGEDVTELAAQAVSIVIAKLPSVIACLLPSVKYFFFLSERKLSDYFSKSKEAGLLVWNVVTIICQILQDGSTVEHLTGATLNRWSMEKLGMVCMCLEHILMKHECSPKQEAQTVIQRIEKQRPKWIENQFQKARLLSMEGLFTMQEDAAALEEEGNTLELTEQKINMMVLDICHKPGGSEYLRQIYHIIQLNEEYLKELLSSQSSPDKKIQPKKPLTLARTSYGEQTSIFNPFQAFSLPGAELFHEPSAVDDWNWDWSNLLASCRGLNEATFKAMLAHRSLTHQL